MNYFLTWNYKTWTLPTKDDVYNFINLFKLPKTECQIESFIEYRGFRISPADPASRKNFQWTSHNEETLNGFADTVEECKREIDNYIEENL